MNLLRTVTLALLAAFALSAMASSTLADDPLYDVIVVVVDLETGAESEIRSPVYAHETVGEVLCRIDKIAARDGKVAVDHYFDFD
ncbi:MAG: hypothetical protein H8E37_05575 [Planctomycetes bacterium]|nr:hypothetical protein [Planctomycetota bacterium]